MRRMRSVCELRRSFMRSSGMVIGSTLLVPGFETDSEEAKKVPPPPVGLTCWRWPEGWGAAPDQAAAPQPDDRVILTGERKRAVLRARSGRANNVLRMLAERGRSSAHGWPATVEGYGQRHEIESQFGHALEDAERFCLRLCQHLAQVLDGGAGNAGLFQDVDPLSLGARGEDAFHQVHQLDPVRAPVAVGGKARVL